MIQQFVGGNTCNTLDDTIFETLFNANDENFHLCPKF